MVITEKVITLIPEAGYSSYDIDTEESVSLQLTGRYDSDLFLRIRKAADVTIHAALEESAKLTLLVWNEAGSEVHFDEIYEVNRNASLHVSYGEVFQGKTVRCTKVTLLGEGAFADVSSAVLTQTDKQFEITVTSDAPNTTGLMHNYSVVLAGGKYDMDAVGVITKGSHGSQSHQTSRSLCFDAEMNSRIIPKLIIDDNDVQASHAASLGRVDEEQLYYMQSRGLSEQQCTALLSTGYLMPIVDTIENEELKGILRAELEEKIAELCSI